MKTNTALGIAFVLFLLGLPLISLGSVRDSDALLYIGLLTVALGAALPPAMRLLEWISGRSENSKESSASEKSKRSKGSDDSSKSKSSRSEETNKSSKPNKSKS